MEPTQQSAAEYYKHHRKRSLFTRLTIITSMAILVLVLAINISLLYSQKTDTVTSHASTPQNLEKLLPSLPAGCRYQHDTNGKMKVTCQKATPTTAVHVPITIALPKLPPQCSFVTSSNGSAVQCANANTPIPTVPVNLPATCTVANKPNSAICSYGNNQTVSVQLPNLPEGCSYFLGANKYYVVCEAK